MNNNISRKIIDITGGNSCPESPTFVLAMENKALSAVATSVTIICFVFLNLIQKSRKKASI